jgi:exopolysaccharide production protein ExoZ
MKMQSLQVLRALAALLVVCDHFPRLEGKLFPDGFMHNFGAAGAIGVDLFFVISGFIMITTTWEMFGTPSASSRFLTRRFLRIYPAYWVALLSFLAIGVVFPAQLFVGPMNLASLASSIFLVPQTAGPLMFVAWSLEFEVYFYIVFALALCFTKKRLPLVLGLWCALTLGLNLASHQLDNSVVRFIGSPLAFEFMGGLIIGYLVLHKRVFAPWVAVSLGTALAVAVAVYSSRLDGFGTLDLTWFRVLAAGPAMLLIVYGAVSLEQQGRLGAPRLAVAVGDASYTMYLWHGILLGAYGALFAHIHAHGGFADALYIFGGFTVVVLGSMAIYRVVETPLTIAARRLFAPMPRTRRVPAPAP